MEDILLAVGRVSKVEEIPAKGKNLSPKIRTTLKLVEQEASGTKNMDHLLKELLVSGQLEFGKNYEIVIRLGAQADLEFPSRMIREEDEETTEVPAPSGFKRPKQKICDGCGRTSGHDAWCDFYSYSDNDKDIDI